MVSVVVFEMGDLDIISSLIVMVFEVDGLDTLLSLSLTGVFCFGSDISLLLTKDFDLDSLDILLTKGFKTGHSDISLFLLIAGLEIGSLTFCIVVFRFFFPLFDSEFVFVSKFSII